MQVKLKRGRFFDERDGKGAPNTIIVDERLAKRFWPDQDPIGRRMYFPTDLNRLLAVTEKTEWFTVAGVIGVVKLDDLVDEARAVGAYYFPYGQRPTSSVTFTIQTAGDPLALASGVRGVIAALDRELPVFDTQTMTERMDKYLANRRSPVLLSLSFGVVALLLSALGIYSVLAYLVTQRRREIGIRIALGSSAAAIFEMVLREGALLVAGGFLLGAAGALALRKSLETQLVGVQATDPVVLSTVTVVLALVALAACALPARRAMKIDPMVALAE